MRPFDDEGNYIYDTNVQHRQGDDIVPDFNIFEERANTSNENTFTSLMSIFDAEFKWNEHFKVTSQFGLQWDENMIENMPDKTVMPCGVKKNSTNTTERLCFRKAVPIKSQRTTVPNGHGKLWQNIKTVSKTYTNWN